MLALEFTDPRLVATYDTRCAYEDAAQPSFYRQLAAELEAALIVDLGCGTGLITCDLARHGHEVVAIDPSPAMLDVARRRCSGPAVRWVVGDIGVAGALEADLALMTGHVAQFFLTDEEWHAALVGLRSALRPGGVLAFESRDPRARAWERWTADARRSVLDPLHGRIESWTEVLEVRDGIVATTDNYVFEDSGEQLVSHVDLRFRTQDELTSSLEAAGFTVDRLYGDWDRRPPGEAERELVVVARS